MNSTDLRGFPWGSNEPTLRQRLIVAAVIGCCAAVVHFFRSAENGGLSDFSTVWFGSKLLLSGQNPYLLIGPQLAIGTPSFLLYPAPALLIVAPFTLLPFHWAGTVFVFVSSVLLALGATRNGWQLLPIFPSIAFITSAQLGQWSILITAALFIPALAFVAIAKPQMSLPVVVSSTDRRVWVFAAIGAALLVAISFVLLPAWPRDWWHLVTTTNYFRAPIASFAGLPIALVLLRWRRPEAWLVFLAACMPQTWYPYNGLLLLFVAVTYREACVLSLVSSAGWLLAYFFVAGEWRSEQTRAVFGNILIALCYLPATMIVLRRQNHGPEPLWLSAIGRRFGTR